MHFDCSIFNIVLDKDIHFKYIFTFKKFCHDASFGYKLHRMDTKRSSGTVCHMQLEKRLSQKKDTILKKWFDQVIKTYPEETSKFFGRRRDKFSNPVGSTVFHGLEAILQELVQGMNHETLKSFLDPIVRIRAVQNFSPSEAVSFVFDLKPVVRECFAKDMPEGEDVNALLEFESKIDTLSLIAFDIYAACREKISELKTSEMRRTTFQALERANLITENPID